jgi:hypothetical protein
VIEKKERRKFRVAPVVEHRVHREAVADPVPLGLLVYAENGFHGL